MIRDLRSERLLLRAWRESDRDAWAAMNADPEAMEHFPDTLDRAAADAAFDRFSDRLEERDWGLWAVEHAGEFLGFTGLNPVGFDATFAPATEVGWRLRRESWGHGLATEAARAASGVAFEALGLDGLVSFTTVGNLRSRRHGARRDDASPRRGLRPSGGPGGQPDPSARALPIGASRLSRGR